MRSAVLPLFFSQSLERCQTHPSRGRSYHIYIHILQGRRHRYMCGDRRRALHSPELSAELNLAVHGVLALRLLARALHHPRADGRVVAHLSPHPTTHYEMIRSVFGRSRMNEGPHVRGQSRWL